LKSNDFIDLHVHVIKIRIVHRIVTHDLGNEFVELSKEKTNERNHMTIIKNIFLIFEVIFRI